MPDTVDKSPFYELDPGSPHTTADDVRKMGISYQPEPSGEPNEQLAAEIRARLQDQARVHADRIAVEVRGNTAVLTGVAADRYERTRAEELAAEVQGIESVANHIAIQPQDESGGPLLTTRTGGEDIEPTTQRS